MTGVSMDFVGRTVVVTGAGRGVGCAHALAFGRRGAAVVVNDVDEDAAAAVAGRTVAAGGRAFANTGDVADPGAGEALVGAALDNFGRLDVIVNNAGIDRIVRLTDVTSTLLREFFDVHLVGTHELCSAAWPYFAERGYGRIVNTTSAAGYFGLAWALPYAAAKGALHAYTQTLAAEGRRLGITANAVAPFAASRLAAARTRNVPQLCDAIEREAPASAVAPVVLWLAHESTAVTGMAFEAGAGAVSRIAVGATPGLSAEVLTPELLRDNVESLLSLQLIEVPDPEAPDRPLTRHLAERSRR